MAPSAASERVHADAVSAAWAGVEAPRWVQRASPLSCAIAASVPVSVALPRDARARRERCWRSGPATDAQSAPFKGVDGPAAEAMAAIDCRGCIGQRPAACTANIPVSRGRVAGRRVRERAEFATRHGAAAHAVARTGAAAHRQRRTAWVGGRCGCWSTARRRASRTSQTGGRTDRRERGMRDGHEGSSRSTAQRAWSGERAERRTLAGSSVPGQAPAWRC